MMSRQVTTDYFIEETSYRQWEKTKKEYYSFLSNTVYGLSNYVSTAIGFAPYYYWVPASLLGLNTQFLSDLWTNGWVTISERDTLHIKTVYLYNDSDGKYWWYGEGEKLSRNYTLTSVWVDSSNNYRSSSTDRFVQFLSSNYDNDYNLFRLTYSKAKYEVGKYYETYTIPSNLYVN